MTSNITNNTSIFSKNGKVQAIKNEQQYLEAIKLLSESNDILLFEDDAQLSVLVNKLHNSIDEYLMCSPFAIELERMCMQSVMHNAA